MSPIQPTMWSELFANVSQVWNVHSVLPSSPNQSNLVGLRLRRRYTPCLRQLLQQSGFLCSRPPRFVFLSYTFSARLFEVIDDLSVFHITKLFHASAGRGLWCPDLICNTQLAVSTASEVMGWSAPFGVPLIMDSNLQGGGAVNWHDFLTDYFPRYKA